VTQTQSLRFVLDASTRSLPPGTWLDAELRGAAREGVLLVPAESVIRTGSGDRVVVVRPDNRFTPIDVQLGSRYDDRFEVLHGLVEGDEIVVSGQFLLDSEAELSSGMQRLRGSGDPESATEPAQQPAHRHAH
jgi:Cu(I)/Ag(I) efflux system membrane fusion protein